MYEKKKIDPPRTRRVKSYPIYKFIQHQGKLVKLFKRATLKEFKAHFNINKTNRIVGWTPDYLGSIKSKHVKSFNYFSSILKEVFNDVKPKLSETFIKDLYNSSVTHRAVYSAGYDTVHDHLKEYFKDNTTDGEWSCENIIKILAYNNFSWFKVPKVSFGRVDELFALVRINKNAFSGHYTSKFKGQKKGQSEIASRSAAARLFTIIKQKPVKNLYLWSILGREKDIKVDYEADNKEIGTRAVLCCENVPMILLMWFAQKFSFILNKEKDMPFNILGEYNGEKARGIVNQEDGFDWKLEADWSYYDSNIDTNFLKVAGAIMISGFPKDKSHKNIGFYIIKSFITKYVIMPPGVVVELNRAQPSGHPFGTLVNCYVNIIYWSIIGFKIYGKDYGNNMKINVYGDDTYAYFKDHPNLIKIDRYVEECKLKSEPLVNNFRRVGALCDNDERIDFLKRRIGYDGITWNYKKMFDKLLYQSKNRGLDDQILLMFSYVETCPNDRDIILLFDHIFKYIRNNKRLYDKISDESIKQRINEVSLLESDIVKKGIIKCNYSFDSYGKYNDFETYGTIYSYRNIIKKDDNKFLNSFLDVPKKLEMLLLAISSNVDGLNNDKDIGTIFNKAPPLLYNKTVEEILAQYYQNTTDECIAFVYRKVRVFK